MPLMSFETEALANILFGKEWTKKNLKYMHKEDSGKDAACDVEEVYMDAEMLEHNDKLKTPMKIKCCLRSPTSPYVWSEYPAHSYAVEEWMIPKSMIQPVFVTPLPLPYYLVNMPDPFLTPCSDNNFTVEEDSFHLADEHEVFVQPDITGTPGTQRPPLRKKSKGLKSRAPRGYKHRGVRRFETDAHKWVPADILIDVNDDDVLDESR